MAAMTFYILLFLFLTTIIGLSYSKDMKTFENFALSKGYFGAKAILFTIVASFVGGGTIMGTAQESFKSGIVYVFALMGFALQLFLTGTFVAPRIERFREHLSIGDIVKGAYGPKAQSLMGFFWLIFCIGFIAAQIKALGLLLNLFLDFPANTNLLIGAAIVIGYCSFGGIRAVVATDIFQFLMMIIALPLILFFTLDAIGGFPAFLERIPSQFLEIPGHASWPQIITLFLSFLFADALIPPVVQRLLMVRKTSHAKYGYIIGGLIVIAMVFMAGMFGMGAYVLNPHMDASNIIKHLLENTMPLSASVFAAFGFVAVVMSTADSYLNSASVAMVNDLVTPLSGDSFSQKELLYFGKLTTLGIGAIALILAFAVDGILPLLLHAFKFWGPAVLVPILAIFCTKKQFPKAFFISCAAGMSMVFIWETLDLETLCYMDSLIPGICTNFLCFLWIHNRIQAQNVRNR